MPNPIPHPISERELNTILSSRTTGSSQAEPMLLADCEISIELNFKTYSNPYSGLYVTPITFRTCIFEKEVKIGDFRERGNLTFVDCLFRDHVTIESIGFISLVNNCHFEKNLMLTVDVNTNSISNLNVGEILNINGSTNEHLRVFDINVGEKIKKQMFVFNCACQQLQVSNIFADEFIIGRSAAFHFLDIANVISRKLNLFSYKQGDIIQFRQSEFQEFTMEDVSKAATGKFKISDRCVIGEMKFLLGMFKTAYVSGSSIKNFEITNTNKKDYLVNIQNSIIDKLVFNDAYNEGLITLRDLNTPDGIISIKSSNIGKTDFIHCDFSRGSFEFLNSKITEAFFSETDFPKTVFVNGVKNHSQSQLAFGQLATAFQKQGDNVRALEYQSREIESHYNNLDWGRKSFLRKLNLWLNKWSNDFGRNWARGMAFTFLIALVFFYTLVISSKEYSIGLGLHWNDNFFSSFFKFINPLRFFETESLFKINQSESYLTLNGISYTIDFFARVLLAYGFYQTIQAFRRFGRK